MEITVRSVVTILHGMGFGALFLLAFSGAFVELCRVGRGAQAMAPAVGSERFLRGYLVLMTVLAWLSVLTGAYIVYPWYRAAAPAGTTDLSLYPQLLLKSSAATIGWHSLGMEWKEHVAWLAPISITMVTAVFFQYGRELRQHPALRSAMLWFTAVAFFAAAVAGFWGAMINKYAPVHGGHVFHLLHGAW
jgi:hypothetical protein